MNEVLWKCIITPVNFREIYGCCALPLVAFWYSLHRPFLFSYLDRVMLPFPPPGIASEVWKE